MTERDIRQWLDRQGFEGGNAKLVGPELFAIGRPGWVQVFQFQVSALRKTRADGQAFGDEDEDVDAVWNDSFGVVLDDERVRDESTKTQIWTFEDQDQQLEKLNEVSQELLRVDRAGSPTWLLFALAAGLGLLVAGAIANFTGS